jgi:hypothetical protein
MGVGVCRAVSGLSTACPANQSRFNACQNFCRNIGEYSVCVGCVCMYVCEYVCVGGGGGCVCMLQNMHTFLILFLFFLFDFSSKH